MIAFSTICYLHGKMMGLEPAAQALAAMARGEKRPGVPRPICLQTAEMVHGLFPLSDFQLRLDTSGSHLGKARARALGWAHAQKADVWVSCDDDCTATPGTLHQLIRLVRDCRTPRAVVVPFAQRGIGQTGELNVVFGPGEPLERGILLPIKYGGFGLVALNGAALAAIVDQRPNWLDADGQRQPLVFNCETLPGHFWLGEDYSFFEQIRPFVECYALAQGESEHAGLKVDLAEVADLRKARDGL